MLQFSVFLVNPYVVNKKLKLILFYNSILNEKKIFFRNSIEFFEIYIPIKCTNSTKSTNQMHQPKSIRLFLLFYSLQSWVLMKYLFKCLKNFEEIKNKENVFIFLLMLVCTKIPQKLFIEVIQNIFFYCKVN